MAPTRDLWFGVAVAAAYLMLRIAVWPVWDRPPAWPDAVLALLVGCAAVAARWTRDH